MSRGAPSSRSPDLRQRVQGTGVHPELGAQTQDPHRESTDNGDEVHSQGTGFRGDHRIRRHVGIFSVSLLGQRQVH